MIILFALFAAADGFEAFLGAGEGIDTGLFGSLIPPLLEFISARYFVCGSLGIASLSTRTNSISYFNFAAGLLNISKLMPNNDRPVIISHIIKTTAG